MARRGSARRRVKNVAWDSVDRLTILGLQVGGIAFGLVSAYLLWGIIAGSLSKAGFLSGQDLQRVLQNIQIACKILTISGVVIVISGCIRFYLDDVMGYILLLVGAGLRWGMPVLVGSSLNDVAIAATTLPAYVAAQYSFVGTVALVTAAPFLLIDFYRKLSEAKRRAARGPIVFTPGQTEEEDVPKGKMCVFCWQMPYCRNYLRMYCQAYERRRSCWRIKSGCYCDEQMILRMMKRSNTSHVAGSDQRYAWIAGDEKGKQLTGAQKRQRCRECAIYLDHQRQKYQVLGPLAFPASLLIMYMYLKPAKAVMHQALQLTDKFAARLSYNSVPQGMQANQWASSPVASNTVEWLFLMCLGLVLVTYIIRGIEYFIFDLQM